MLDFQPHSFTHPHISTFTDSNIQTFKHSSNHALSHSHTHNSLILIHVAIRRGTGTCPSAPSVRLDRVSPLRAKRCREICDICAICVTWKSASEAMQKICAIRAICVTWKSASEAMRRIYKIYKIWLRLRCLFAVLSSFQRCSWPLVHLDIVQINMTLYSTSAASVSAASRRRKTASGSPPSKKILPYQKEYVPLHFETSPAESMKTMRLRVLWRYSRTK